MKYLLIACLALLLFTGCAQDVPVPQQPQTETTVLPDIPVSLYIPSAVESETAGRVRSFAAEDLCLGVRKMGEERLIAFAEDGSTRLLLCSGPDCDVRLGQTVPFPVDFAADTTCVTEHGIVCVDRSTEEVVILGSQLQEVKRIALNSACYVVSPDMSSIYYCTETEVRAIDLKSDISRLIYGQQTGGLKLIGCSDDGSVIACAAIDQDGTESTLLINTADGKTEERLPKADQIQLLTDEWLMVKNGNYPEVTFRLDGVISQFNWQGLQPQEIFPAFQDTELIVVTYSNEGAQIHHFDMRSGIRTALLELPGVSEVKPQLLENSMLWFLTSGDSVGGSKLLCWDITTSWINDTAVYTEQWYTAESPDTEGLALCKERADNIGSKYGVDVRIWQDALSIVGEYQVTGEYQTGAYDSALEVLETSLAQYPEGFFTMLMNGVTGGKLHVCLVHSISNWNGGAQIWDNGDAYILLPVGIGQQIAFHQEMCHILDTFVIGKTKAIDDWEQLNPDDFCYSGSNDSIPSGFDGYLSGEGRAFVDDYSMTFPREDRASIFAAAITPGNEEIFASAIMQRKLSAVCTAIREAFGWKDVQETFRWEQYLSE